MRSVWPLSILVFGIVLAGFNLRPGVTGLSPLLEMMGREIPVDSVFLAIIGMLPPLLYGLSGFITPKLVTRYSAITVTLGAMILICVGLGVRVLLDSPSWFLVFSVVALLGMGIGNVVIPPIVKSYFPNRLALMSTVHVSMLQLGTFIPPLFAVPLAQSLNWRGSLLVWVACALLGVIVWALIAVIKPQSTAEVSVTSVGGTELRRLLGNRRAWALMLMTGLTSFNNFILFTWLPSLLTRAGFSPAFAGAMLALVTAIPFLLGLVVPALVQRMRSPFSVVVVFCACLATGYLGLWLAPQLLPVVWTVLLGIGVSTFPLALTLITVRSRSVESTAALSGFVQGGGYLLAASGPLLFALLVQSGGSLWPAFALVLASTVIKLAVSYTACRPGQI